MTLKPDTIYPDTLALIGHTPIVKVNHIDTGPCELFLKLENQNPGGSIKDRIALRMIAAAEAAGSLQPGGTIVEATAGNTGIGLAMVAALKGYHCVIVMPDKMSREKIFHLKALGAEVIMTRSDVNKGHPEYYQDLAARVVAERNNAIFIEQFNNPHNVATHYEETGPEIWAQMDHRLDAFVAGMGTSGTLTGAGRFFKEVNPAIDLVLADPVGSILADYVNKRQIGSAASWLVEGIGEDFIPSISEIDRVDTAITVSDRDSFLAARMLLQKEGLLGGSSTGTLLQAALTYCRAQTTPKRVLTFVCDTGNKYLSKLYNDYWMVDQGFMSRPSYGDLRDIISRLHTEKATVVVGVDEPLATAHNRMRIHDVSQLPVLDERREKVVGILDESDLLLAVIADKQRFQDAVASVMTTDLQVLAPNDSIDRLTAIFKAGLAAIVMEGQEFVGLITQIDLINYLRRETM